MSHAPELERLRGHNGLLALLQGEILDISSLSAAELRALAAFQPRPVEARRYLARAEVLDPKGKDIVGESPVILPTLEERIMNRVHNAA